MDHKYIKQMATQAPTQMELAGSSGQSAWNHAVATYGGMGQQHAGVGNTIAMKGGRKSRRQRQSRSQSRRQSLRQSLRQRRTWDRKSRKQRGGRR